MPIISSFSYCHHSRSHNSLVTNNKSLSLFISYLLFLWFAPLSFFLFKGWLWWYTFGHTEYQSLTLVSDIQYVKIKYFASRLLWKYVSDKVSFENFDSVLVCSQPTDIKLWFLKFNQNLDSWDFSSVKDISLEIWFHLRHMV